MKKYIIKIERQDKSPLYKDQKRWYSKINEILFPFDTLADAVIHATTNHIERPIYEEYIQEQTKSCADIPLEDKNITTSSISNCTFTSNDTFNINVAEAVSALASAVEQNAIAIQSICDMIQTTTHVRGSPFISLSKTKE